MLLIFISNNCRLKFVCCSMIGSYKISSCMQISLLKFSVYGVMILSYLCELFIRTCILYANFFFVKPENISCQQQYHFWSKIFIHSSINYCLAKQATHETRTHEGHMLSIHIGDRWRQKCVLYTMIGSWKNFLYLLYANLLSFKYCVYSVIILSYLCDLFHTCIMYIVSCKLNRVVHEADIVMFSCYSIIEIDLKLCFFFILKLSNYSCHLDFSTYCIFLVWPG